MLRRSFALSLLIAATIAASSALAADPKPAPPSQAEFEAALAKMLSGATLDGNFTMTGPGSDPTKLIHDKYTLGEVKKLDGNKWQIAARIQYGDKDFALPLTLPIEWAGDTPVIIVDNLGLPGFEGVSARVMFFDDHYAGYWKHGDRGGSMFGEIKRAAEAK